MAAAGDSRGPRALRSGHTRTEALPPALFTRRNPKSALLCLNRSELGCSHESASGVSLCRGRDSKALGDRWAQATGGGGCGARRRPPGQLRRASAWACVPRASVCPRTGLASLPQPPLSPGGTSRGSAQGARREHRVREGDSLPAAPRGSPCRPTGGAEPSASSPRARFFLRGN